MSLSGTQQIVGVVVLAVAAAGLATMSVRSYVRDGQRDLRQRPVEERTLQAIETATRELLAVEPSALAAHLQKALSPNARPEAAAALAAALEQLREAASWTLAAADGYGPSLIKAIYDLTDANGGTRRMALMFETKGDVVVLLDVSL